MNNVVQDRVDILNLVAPSGGVTVGVPVMIGALCVIPVASAAVGELFAGQAIGVFRLPKHSGTAFTAGQLVEWDVSAGELIAVGSTEDDIQIGHVVTAAGSSDTTAVIAKTNPAPTLNPGT